MTWTWTEHEGGLDGELRSAWDGFEASSAHPHPQRSAWWVEAWLRRFPVERARVVAWRQDGVVRALLPVVERREREPRSPLTHRVLTHAGDGFTDALPLLVAPGDDEALEQVAVWLDECRTGFDEVRVSPLIEGEASFPLLEKLAARDWDCERVEGNPLLALDAGWEEMVLRVGRNLRKDVGKKKRRLDEAGWSPELTLERACGPELLEELRALAARRFEHEGHKSSLLEAERFAFIGEAGALATQRGEFACFACRHEERLLGYRLGFLHGGAFFDWITSYDPEFFPYSIGKLILWDIVEALLELGVERLDFMAGEEDYKLKWLPDVRGMHRCRARRASAANLVRGLVRTASKVKGAWSS